MGSDPFLLSSLDEANDVKQENGTNCCGHNRPYQATRGDAQHTEDKSANHCAYNSDDNIPWQSKSTAFHKLAGQPAGHGADCEKYEQAF
jgi:hypothetical protein